MGLSLQYKILAMIVLSFVITATASAQAFGIAGGTPESNLRILERTRGNSVVIEPPVKHPAFETYMALSSQETGVCRVTGLGRTISNDAYGQRVQSEFADISTQLNSRYGKSKKFDYLQSGSIWNEPREWSMAVSKNQRELSRFWDREEHSTLPPGLNAVTLTTKALDSDRTYVTLVYEFTNITRCLAARSANSASRL